MQLLSSRAAPGGEFASFSLLLCGGDGDAGAKHPVLGVEPVLVPSPLSTLSQTSCVRVLTELHSYIHAVVRASKSNTATKSNEKDSSTKGLLLRDDEILLSAASASTASVAQMFRPQHGDGIALYYRVIRDKKRIYSLVSLLFNRAPTLSASKLKPSKLAAAGAALEKETMGVIFCVGVSGLPAAHCTSSLTANLGVRMRDCLDILCKTATNSGTTAGSEASAAPPAAAAVRLQADLVATRSLVTTLLLTDDEDRITNFMAGGAHRLLIAQDDKDVGSKLLGSSIKKQQQQNPFDNPNAIDPDENPLHFNSADHARLVVERLAILSVCESDTTFRRFEARTREGTSKKRMRKSTRDADLDGFDFRGGDMRSSSSRSSIGNHIREGSTTGKVGLSSSSLISSSASDTASLSLRSTSSNNSSGLALRGPRKDTTSRSMSRPGKSSVPALLASSKDSGAIRTRRSTGNRRAPNDGAVISNFPAASTHSKQMSVRSMQSDAVSLSSGKTPPGSIGSRSQSKGREQFDPFASQDMFHDTPSAVSKTSFGQDGGFEQGNGNQGGFGKGNEKSRSGGSSAKVLVNVALNEDLTCFYKLSKMSSCSVEGVVQVQVQTNVDQGVPFFLLIRDPAKHIMSVQENKKFADNMAESLHGEHPSRRPDYMFTVSVPKADNYFPVMRYKCGTELRPVPIRVQTRVRQEENFYRVALQISSNPHNEDNLTDLTIIMGVPPEVLGETLTTSPPGGVWNGSKRSVIWCVSELGGGEKFQLQARFEKDPDAPKHLDEDMPKFPVLVRCQCVYAQLSDIEVDVRDIPQVVNAEVKMKLARRFRLSHRERP